MRGPCLPVTVPQDTTEPPAAHHPPSSCADIFHRLDQPIAPFLMIPFSMVVSKELANRQTKHRFAEENHMTEALVLDGPNEALDL